MARFTLLLPAFAAVSFMAPALLAPANAANLCSAPPLSCATTMPIGGYCECTSRGMTQDGTVVEAPVRGKRINSTAGGCGAQPNAPGCR